MTIGIVCVIGLSHCSFFSPNYRQGLELYRSQNYVEAIEHLEQALREEPKNSEIRLLLYKTKLNLYFNYLARARGLKEAEKQQEAVEWYRKALAIFPNNKTVKNELENYLKGREIVVDKPFVSSITPPIKLDLKSSDKVTVKLNRVVISKILKSIGKSYGINFIFDKDFRDFVYDIDVENIDFHEILSQLCMVANSKYRILNPSTVLVYPDNAFKNRAFALQGIRVFYLSHVKAEDAKTLTLAVFRTEQPIIQEDKNLNSLIVRGSHSVLSEIEQFIVNIDKPRSEVAIDVEILEINRNLLNKLGTDYSVSGVSLTAGEDDSQGGINTTLNLDSLKDTNFYLTVPSVALNLLLSDDNNKIIAKPNLRGIDGEDITFMVGDEVPIPQTTLGAIATGGIPTVPQTTYQYKNVGVTVEITPTIHRNREVTLKCKMTINFISAYIDSFPVLGKRELDSTIRLKEGETNIIGGFIREEVRGTLAGIPGLARIPILGKLFGSTERNNQQKDLIFAITPRIIRKLELTSTNKKTIWSGSQQTQAAAPPAGTRPAQGPGPLAQVQPQGNSLIISPTRRRVPLNSTLYFALRLNVDTPIVSLSIGGEVTGGKVEIVELKTDFLNQEDVKTLKNFSGNSFDAGFSFPNSTIKNKMIGQLRVKFMEKGTYRLTINSLNIYTSNKGPVSASTNTAEIEVF